VMQAVIFDIDGTLVDSNAAHAQSWVDALAEAGYDANPAALEHQPADRRQRQRPVRRRIGVSEAAAARAAVPNLEMADQSRRLRDEGD